MKTRSLAKLSIAILVPIAMGAAYAIGTGGDSQRAAAAMAETARATESMKAEVQAVAVAHRTARAKCGHLGAVERGNCRTEARAEAKRALKVVREVQPRG
jgi:hypothetical protein